MKRVFHLWLWWFAFALSVEGATHTVEFEKTITMLIPRATAAYAVDPTIAEASADRGVVTVLGKSPGTTHVIVVTPEGVQSLEIVVPMPAPLHPRGWVTPRTEGESNETGYFETRYSSLPQQLTNVIDFAHHNPDMSSHFHLAVTDFFPSRNNPFNSYYRSSFAVTSLFYEVKTQDRDVTLVDQLVAESPLTVDGAVVRGLHWREGNWFFHGGYTSPAAFENVFLPVRREGVFGVGYRYQLSAHSWFIPSVYYLSMHAANYTGKPGSIFSLLYSYRPSNDFHLAAELGESRGLGGSFDLLYRRTAEILRIRARYTPSNFASLSLSNFRGLYSDAAWSRKWSEQLSTDLNFTGDRFNLPSFQETVLNSGVQLRYSPTRRWTLFGGITYSRFQMESPRQAPLQGTYYPVGLSFNSHRFGATFQHQWSRYTDRNTGGHQLLASMRTGWGQLGFSAYVERETQAPTLSFLLAQVQGLQQLLTQLGVTANTPQDIINFLAQNALLINLNYLQNITINVTPIREQASGSVSWQSRGRQPQVDYEYLYNNDQTITGSTQVAIHRITMTQRLGVSNDLSATWAQYRTKTPGRPSEINPLYAVSLRHHFNSAPAFVVLRHHGTIRGTVFEDRDAQGLYADDAPGVGGVEIILDQQRRTRTESDGSFRFPRISQGTHQLQAVLHDTAERSYYFTTPEHLEVEADAEVHFGVAYSRSSLVVQVANDSNQPVRGIPVVIQGEGRRFTATSGADGRLLLPRLSEGTYDVAIDAEALPPGYFIAAPYSEQLTIVAGFPGKVTLQVGVLRSVAGRVLIYDRPLGQYVPIAGQEVVLHELSRGATTDNEGRYLFRNLPSGTFTISVVYQGQPINQIVKLPDEPSLQSNIDLIVGQR